MKKWTIEYGYDCPTGQVDDGFYEWWILSDGTRSLRCFSEEDANWLCELLNKQCPP